MPFLIGSLAGSCPPSAGFLVLPSQPGVCSAPPDPRHPAHRLRRENEFLAAGLFMGPWRRSSGVWNCCGLRRFGTERGTSRIGARYRTHHRHPDLPEHHAPEGMQEHQFRRGSDAAGGQAVRLIFFLDHHSSHCHAQGRRDWAVWRCGGRRDAAHGIAPTLPRDFWAPGILTFSTMRLLTWCSSRPQAAIRRCS